MSNLFGWSNGSSGVGNVGGAHAPGVALVSGSSGSRTLSGTYPYFFAGQLILILQVQGTNVGKFQLNRIKSYVAGTITLERPLNYTYATGGSNYAIAQIIPQYTTLTFSSTVTTNVWSGTSGGVIAFCADKIIVNKTLNAAVTGFYGGNGATSGTVGGEQGDGSVGGGVVSASANGSGGGGGPSNGAGGGGGGNAGAGIQGRDDFNNLTNPRGTGGLAVAGSSSDDIHFGGGGGAGGRNSSATPGDGGRGGGIILLIAKEIYLVSGGYLGVSGAVGQNSSTGFSAGAGGGGAGGTIYLLGQYIDIGTNQMNLQGGAGGTGLATYGGDGGKGGNGKLVVDCCSMTGSLSSSYADIITYNQGGQDFCGSGIAIVE